MSLASEFKEFAMKGSVIDLAVGAVLVGVAATAHFAAATPVLAFSLAALAIAVLARLVGGATQQLGSRVGSSVASVVQSALGNLPELFIALFAIRKGLIGVVQAALVGSIIANSVLVLGIAFVVGGVRNGTQTFDSPRARMIATLTAMAAAILALPTLAHAFHAPAAAHTKTLSLICSGVLLVLFFLTLPYFLAAAASPGPYYFSDWPRHFDFVFVLFTQPGAHNPDAGRLTLVDEGRHFQLYRVIKPP